MYVVEQDGKTPFNRAMLMNVGAAEAVKQQVFIFLVLWFFLLYSVQDYQCFIFHDVDLLPEDDRNLYTCPIQPRHMSVSIDSFLYRLPYDDIFGGVSAMTVDQFQVEILFYLIIAVYLHLLLHSLSTDSLICSGDGAAKMTTWLTG